MVAVRQISEQRDFVVSSASLKDVRSFSREVFEKVNIEQDLKDELVLAIAEAAQNIVKHAYQGEDTEDKMEIKISLNNGELEIGFLIREDLLIKKMFGTEKLMMLNQVV